MPEMVGLGPEKSETGQTGSLRRFSVEPDHLRDLRHLRTRCGQTASSAVIEIPGCLAWRGVCVICATCHPPVDPSFVAEWITTSRGGGA